MKNVFLAVFLLLGSALSAQTVIINGERTNRLLKWDDFTGTPDHSADLYAYTYWYVSYKWGAFPFKGDTVKWKVEVTLELEKRSWKKPDKISDSLLAHEQGHFHIGLLFAKAFQERVNATVFFRPDYQSRIEGIFNEERERFRQMELLYDKETAHFRNREQQKKWNEFFGKELGKTR